MHIDGLEGKIVSITGSDGYFVEGIVVEDLRTEIRVAILRSNCEFKITGKEASYEKCDALWNALEVASDWKSNKGRK